MILCASILKSHQHPLKVKLNNNLQVVHILNTSWRHLYSKLLLYYFLNSWSEKCEIVCRRPWNKIALNSLQWVERHWRSSARSWNAIKLPGHLVKKSLIFCHAWLIAWLLSSRSLTESDWFLYSEFINWLHKRKCKLIFVYKKHFLTPLNFGHKS